MSRAARIIDASITEEVRRARRAHGRKRNPKTGETHDETMARAKEQDRAGQRLKEELRRG